MTLEKIKKELEKIKKQIKKIEEIIDLEEKKWNAISYGGTDPD